MRMATGFWRWMAGIWSPAEDAWRKPLASRRGRRAGTLCRAAVEALDQRLLLSAEPVLGVPMRHR